MDLDRYVDSIHRHVAVAADAAGEDARALADRLITPLDAAIRLAVQQALADAADEITVELAPGSVEVRIRGRELAFVFIPPPADTHAAGDADPRAEPPEPEPPAGDEGEMMRINLRLPEQLKARVEQAASAQRVSVNAWLVRAAGAALDRTDPPRAPRAPQPSERGTHRYRGWAR
jgi:hypothetical protein